MEYANHETTPCLTTYIERKGVQNGKGHRSSHMVNDGLLLNNNTEAHV